MRVKKRLRIRWLSLFFLLVLPIAAQGGVPEVSHVMVTDVTTRSFSVIWAASEASTANLAVFKDEYGNESAVADEDIIPHPIGSGDDTIRTAAENNGVMKVRVTGLAPDTTYYFKTITTSSTGSTVDYPDAESFTPVTTESETVRTYESGGDVLPFSNDLIIEPCYLDDGTTFAVGTLLLATVAGGSHPITAFVGDGVELPYALIDLNNVFSRDAHDNLDLLQGLNLTLLNFRGLANSIVTHVVPEDQSLSEVKPPEFGLKAGWNFVSFQLEPGDTGLETVLAQVIDEVSAVWTYNTEEDKWYKYLKEDEYGVSDLDSMHSLLGYWILMEEGKEASLKVHGNFVTNESIPLYSMNSGWNLIGYRSAEVVDVADLVGPEELIHSQVDAIWTYNTESDTWQKYLREDEYGVTDLFYLIPGKAYWVLVNSDCTL